VPVIVVEMVVALVEMAAVVLVAAAEVQCNGRLFSKS
jgi:hypothetical protein